MKIIQATTAHVERVAKLFDLYRQFYDQAPDYLTAAAFIRARITGSESTIFLAMDEREPAGFVQLYPSFCSVDAVKIQILYDLYVDKPFRKKGIAEALMHCATDFARASGAQRIDLLTGVENKPGQALYEKLDYYRSLDDFIGYSLGL